MNARMFLRIATVVAFLALFLVAVFFLWKILAPFFLSYILFFALKPLVNMLEHRGVSHVFSVIIVFFCVFGGFALLCLFLVPALIDEFSNIRANFDTYTHSFSLLVERLKSFLSGISFGSFSFSSGVDSTSFFQRRLASYTRFIPGILTTIALYFMVIPFATFFLLLDERSITKRMISMVPNRYFEVTLNLLYNLNRQFGLILRGMLVSVVIISLLSTLGLRIINLPFPIIIGVFAGVSNLIPYAGPIVGIAAAVATALMTGARPEMYLSILVVFAVVQFIDNVFVQPLVLAKSSNLHPLLVLFLVIFGSTFGGIIGMFLIVPVVSLCRITLTILFRDLLRPPRPDFSLFRDADPASVCS